MRDIDYLIDELGMLKRRTRQAGRLLLEALYVDERFIAEVNDAARKGKMDVALDHLERALDDLSILDKC